MSKTAIIETSEKEEKYRMFVIVDIGCIECGESTEILLITPSEQIARETMERLHHEHGKNYDPKYWYRFSYFNGGQHEVEVFDKIPITYPIHKLEEEK